METEAVLACVRDELDVELANFSACAVRPLCCNKWVASSVMQKAIRRGDAETVSQAAATLLTLDPATLRRRLLVVSAEDVGVGEPVIMSGVSAALDGAAWRRSRGERRIIGLLVRLLAMAPKSRDADLMAAIVSHHPDYAEAMSELASAETHDLFELLRDPTEDLILRGIAALYAAGTREGRNNNIQARRGCDGIWQVLLDMGAPASLVAAAQVNFRRTGSHLALWTTLFHLACRESTVTDKPLPVSPTEQGIPLYAVDYHTRIGKQAVREWRAQSPELRRYPLRGVQLGLFYSEGSLTRPQFHWDWSERLWALGAEAEMVSAGLTNDDFDPLRRVVENELTTLHDIRRRLLRYDPSPWQADLFGGPVE